MTWIGKTVWFNSLKRTEEGQKEPDYNGREVGSKGDVLRSQSSSLRAEAQNVISAKGESKKTTKNNDGSEFIPVAARGSDRLNRET